jgi:hypothetical protein
MREPAETRKDTEMKELSTDELLKAATPRPWQILDTVDRSLAIGTETTNVCVLAHGDTREESEPDAELIRRAVNSFEAMRNALTVASATIDRLHRHAPCSAKGTLDVIANALAQAEGKAVVK